MLAITFANAGTTRVQLSDMDVSLTYRLYPYALRSIRNYTTHAKRWSFETEVSRDRHGDTIGEMVHVSVLHRMGRVVSCNNRQTI
jgi:hypothetical protein